MRYLIHGALAVLLLSGGAFAQNAPASGQSGKPDSGNARQDQSGNARTAPSSSSPQTPAPSQPAKDESLTNFDVNGSNGQDAMGGAPR